MESDAIRAILGDVLQREGWPTITQHPMDRGGLTKGGITHRTLEQWRGRRVTRRELERLTEKEALSILERRYVFTNGIYLVADDALKEQLIDSAVLSGPVNAVQDLQGAIGVSRDGIIGPITLGGIDSVGAQVTRQRLAVARTLRLAKIAAKDPTQNVFLVGWLKRSLGFLPAVTKG
jgi:lysozyme family protein